MNQEPTITNGITRIDHCTRTEFGIPYDRPTFTLNSWVTVYHPQITLDEKPRASEINWSSIGSKRVEQTELFIEAMNQAIQLAKELNSKQGETK